MRRLRDGLFADLVERESEPCSVPAVDLEAPFELVDKEADDLEPQVVRPGCLRRRRCR